MRKKLFQISDSVSIWRFSFNAYLNKLTWMLSVVFDTVEFIYKVLRKKVQLN